MRKIILAVIGLLAVAYLVYSLAELQNILATLRQSDPLYLFAAVGVEAVLMFNSTATFWMLYRLVGLSETRRRMFLLVAASTFVNGFAPSAGVGGMAVFLDAARQRGQSTGRVLVTGVLYLIYEYTSLFVALVAGFIVLAQRAQLNMAELTAAGFMLILFSSIGVGLIVGYRSTRQLGDLLAWLARGVNRLLQRFLHKDYLNIESAYTFSNEMADGFASLRANRQRAIIPLAFTLMNKLLLILVLALAFLAMGAPLDGGTVVAGFSIGHLFVYASPTPSGVGIVDSVLPVALSSMHVPFPRAVLVVLTYRAVTFWLPLVLGALAFRYLQRLQTAKG